MRRMTRWPWIAIALGIVAALTPPGREIVRNAFFSGEALSRNIARPFLFLGLLAFAVLALIEWYVRLRFSRRRDKTSPAANTKTE